MGVDSYMTHCDHCEKEIRVWLDEASDDSITEGPLPEVRGYRIGETHLCGECFDAYGKALGLEDEDGEAT